MLRKYWPVTVWFAPGLNDPLLPFHEDTSGTDETTVAGWVFEHP